MRRFLTAHAEPGGLRRENLCDFAVASRRVLWYADAMTDSLQLTDKGGAQTTGEQGFRNKCRPSGQCRKQSAMLSFFVCQKRTVQPENRRRTRHERMEHLQRRRLAERDQRPRLHSEKLHPVRRRRRLPRARDRSHHRAARKVRRPARRGARQGRRAQHRHGYRHHHHRIRPGLPGQGQRDHRRPADRRAVKARLQPVRRHAHGARGVQGLWLRSLPPNRGGV